MHHKYGHAYAESCADMIYKDNYTGFCVIWQGRHARMKTERTAFCVNRVKRKRERAKRRSICGTGKKHIWAVAGCLLGLLGAVILTAWAAERSAAVTTAAETEIRLPIIMYHSILKDPDSTGPYVITPATLEEDLRYLRDHGYQTVVVADLIAYVDDGTPLPEKPVMLTLDDGYLNNLTYLLPLLEQYEMRAVVSVIGRYTELYSNTPDPNPAYAHLTWSDICTLAESGRVEIQNHSYDMHRQAARRGAGRKNGESMAVYTKVLTEDVQTLQTLLQTQCGITPTAFVYPYGQVSSGADEILADLGFRCTMSCEERVNRITRSESSLFCLGRFNRAGTESTTTFMRKIESSGR